MPGEREKQGSRSVPGAIVPQGRVESELVPLYILPTPLGIEMWTVVAPGRHRLRILDNFPWSPETIKEKSNEESTVREDRN